MYKRWSREETIVAFNVYCKIPFKKSNKKHPLIVKYAKILGRTPDALNLKIGNIGSLDPALKKQGIVGLGHRGKMEEIVWEEFYNDPERLAYESERLIAEFSKQNLETSSMIDLTNLPEGKEREAVVKQRVNQSFFRSTVLSAYNYRCCVTGISNPELLEACHIVDWTEDSKNRTNPQNGLSMNPLFHKAYDKHLISITPDMEIIVSDEMISKAEKSDFQKYLRQLNGTPIIRPDRFSPKRELLEIHYNLFKSR